MKWIPVSSKTIKFYDFIRSSWQVSAPAITVGNGSLINNTLSPNATAWIEMEIPFIYLPNAMVDEIHTLIRANRLGWSPFFAVPKNRDGFPDIAFT